MDRVTAARACDGVPGGDVADARADCDHDTGRGVAERRGLVETGAHGGDRLRDAVAPRLLEHLPHLVRARARLRYEALAPGLDLTALGPGADEAPPDIDYPPRRRQLRLGHVHDLDAAVAQPLRHLLQAGASTNVCCQSSIVSSAQIRSALSVRP